jgi:hypothetical protein
MGNLWHQSGGGLNKKESQVAVTASAAAWSIVIE